MGLKFQLLEKEDASPMTASQRRGDLPTLVPPSGSGLRPLAAPTAEADQFLQILRRDFADKPEKFELFGAVLIDYYHMNIDMAGLVDRMQVVLNGYPNLVGGFNTFLPSGFALKNDKKEKDHLVMVMLMFSCDFWWFYVLLRQ